ncbi:MAG TPA: AbrB/MazE/SpoVT family DNA-binding domain-containing protein [Rhodanobacteraceae bacterium]|nr:AbrB/MazE/SpoVT family DNA-binding domain-containing protein [Rhodanobacteraceae bacterium]
MKGYSVLAKMTSKNQLTLPKAIVDAFGAVEYFDVEARGGQIVLTPVRIQRADAVRAKLAELAIDESDVRDAVAWARGAEARRVAEPQAEYSARPPKKRARSKRDS